MKVASTVFIVLGFVVLPIVASAQATLNAVPAKDMNNENDPGVTILEAATRSEDPEEPQVRGIEHEDIGVTSEQTSLGTEIEDIGAPAQNSEGSEREDIGAPSDPGSASGGNAETTWKVEKGEKSPEPDDEVIVVFEHGNAGGEDGKETRMNKSDLIAELERQAAVFVKIGDIKGEADDSASGGDGDIIITGGGIPQAKKPKEIVVVGSKVRDKASPSIQLAIAKGKHLEDSSSTAGSPDVFFDITYIRDDEDAAVHAVAVVQSDENIREARITDEEVTVDYETTVHMFGFIPVRASQEATVTFGDGEHGRVKVRMPWWSALGRKTVRPHDLQTAIEEAYVLQRNESDLNFLQERARTLQTMSNVMKMMHDTAMAVIRKIG